MSFPQRGEIYYVEFIAVRGSEMHGPHPALIVQNNGGNEFSPVVIVAAITSKMSGVHLPITVLVEAGEGNLREWSLIHCGQLATVDKTRLGQFVGRISEARMRAVDHALAVSLGLEEPAEFRRRTRR